MFVAMAYLVDNLSIIYNDYSDRMSHILVSIINCVRVFLYICVDYIFNFSLC